MKQKQRIVLFGLSCLCMSGCSYFVDNDEYEYLRKPAKSTPDLILPEGTPQPVIEPYMPLPAGNVEYPATKENVDFKPPVDA